MVKQVVWAFIKLTRFKLIIEVQILALLMPQHHKGVWCLKIMEGNLIIVLGASRSLLEGSRVTK